MEIKVIKGVHEKSKGIPDKIITLEIDGREFERQWTAEMLMEPYMVAPMLDEMGINVGESINEEPELRKALQEYCLDLISYEYGYITQDELSKFAHGFWAGFEKGRKVQA